MGILGLTHDENGVALERLPVTIKVAIGEGPQRGEQNGHPRRLDHFVFKRKTLRGQDVVWERATDIAKVYGEKPTELGIIFLNDDATEVLRTEYAWWTPAGCKCHGHLVQIENGNGVGYEMRAVRITQKHPEGEPWPGTYKYVDGPMKGQPVPSCGDACPDLERGDCRPSGDLYFMLEKFPTLGAVCRIHTSSYRSVRNLSNGLMQIRRFNGGRLTGIKALLKATPEKIWYSDGDGFRHSSVAYILSLEIAATNIPGLVASMTEPVRLLEQSRGGFRSNGKVQYVVRETDAERAEEIAAEFYPNNGSQSAEPTESTDGPTEEDEQTARICELARKLGYNEAKIRMKLGQWARKLTGLERELLNELDALPDDPDRGSDGTGAKPNGQEGQESTRAAEVPNSPATPTRAGNPGSGEGFLF